MLRFSTIRSSWSEPDPLQYVLKMGILITVISIPGLDYISNPSEARKVILAFPFSGNCFLVLSQASIRRITYSPCLKS